MSCEFLADNAMPFGKYAGIPLTDIAEKDLGYLLHVHRKLLDKSSGTHNPLIAILKQAIETAIQERETDD